MNINKEIYPARGLVFYDKDGGLKEVTADEVDRGFKTVAEVEELPEFVGWACTPGNIELGLIESPVDPVPEVAAFDDPDNPVPELLPCKPIRKAGLGSDPLDQVTRDLVDEVRDFTQEMLNRVLKATSHQNFGRAMHLINRISKAQADFTIDLIPGIERFEQGEDRPGGLGEGNDLPSIETFGASMMKELTAHLSGQNAEKNKPDINRLLDSLANAQEMGQTKVAEAIQKKIDEVVESGEFVAKDWVALKARAVLPPAKVPPRPVGRLNECMDCHTRYLPGKYPNGCPECDPDMERPELKVGTQVCISCGHEYWGPTYRWGCPKCGDLKSMERTLPKEDRDADDVVSPEDQR